ncbi:hypothetical protein PR202_gb16943 [Eleusine coracana subsp. coracana]|uniref:Uncharacterized protein n=1 Tax=Eleusine coracana subsp. coracana TaxID=191504 RepID=A0AAV5EZC4_ELECO|nr:hypothetical protein PR202_gb16943 [Eleusine coracana subsp. coracana]
MALRVRWLWLKKVEPDKAWASLPIQRSEGVKALYSLATSTEIGNGASTLFWEDRWLLGQRIQDLSPLLSGMVPKRISNKRTVSEAIADMCWVWWEKAAESANSSVRKGLNSYVTLGAWVLWRHQNDCVFNGASPNLTLVLRTVGDEVRMWSMAGAKGLSLLTSYDASSKLMAFVDIKFRPGDKICFGTVSLIADQHGNLVKREGVAHSDAALTD